MADDRTRRLGEDREYTLSEQMKILRDNGLDRIAKMCEEAARSKEEWNKLIEKAYEKLLAERQAQKQEITPLKDTLEAIREKPPSARVGQSQEPPPQDRPPSPGRGLSYDDIYREHTSRDNERQQRGQDHDRDDRNR